MGIKKGLFLTCGPYIPVGQVARAFINMIVLVTFLTKHNVSKELAFCKANLDSLKSFELTNLSDNNKTDYQMIESQLHATEWYTNNYKSYEWNPSDYNVCGGFAEMLANNYDSLDARLQIFYQRMRNIPAYYEVSQTTN